MSKCNSIIRALVVGLIGVGLWQSIGVLAQQRTTTSPNRTGGGEGGAETGQVRAAG